MISGSFCVACFEDVCRYATRQRSRLKLWNESGTNRARIGDSVQLLKRSPQHLALMIGDGTRSSSEPSHKQLFFNGFLKVTAGAESNQKWSRVKLDSWGCGLLASPSLLLPPRPACGERVGVRGRISKVDLADRPPHPIASRSTSPRARGEVNRAYCHQIPQVRHSGARRRRKPGISRFRIHA